MEERRYSVDMLVEDDNRFVEEEPYSFDLHIKAEDIEGGGQADWWNNKDCKVDFPDILVGQHNVEDRREPGAYKGILVEGHNAAGMRKRVPLQVEQGKEDPNWRLEESVVKD
jgi:hypothetical protein